MIDWTILILVNILVPALLIFLVVKAFMGSKLRGTLSGIVGFMIIAMVCAQYYTGNWMNGLYHPIDMGWKLLYEPLITQIHNTLYS